MIELLVNAGASLKTSEPKEMGLLHTMVANQKPHGLKIFLKLGADWFQEWRDNNAFWYVIKYPFQGKHADDLYSETVDILAHGHPGGTKGTSLFTKEGSLSTALHAAAKYGNDKVAKRLIVWGAVIDARDKFGHTPLWLAAAHGHVDIAMFLLNAGADIDVVGIEGSTPLRVASRNGGVGKKTIPNFVQVSRQVFECLTPPLFLYLPIYALILLICFLFCFQMVALLLAHGANELKAKLSHTEGVGAMQKALSLADKDTLARLVGSSKSQVNATLPQNGRTALHQVC